MRSPAAAHPLERGAPLRPREAADDREAPREQAFPWVYDAGAWEKYSCRFNVDDSRESEAELVRNWEPRRHLAACLREALDAGASLELRAFWAGELLSDPDASLKERPKS